MPGAARRPRRPAPPGSSARCGESAALENDAALGLGQPAPDAERLPGLQRELPAHVDHWAAVADLLGLRRTPRPRRVPLAVRVEEHRAVHATARTEALPLPGVVHRAGEPGDVAHVAVLFSSVTPSQFRAIAARLPSPPGR